LDTNNIAISMVIMLMHHEILGQIQPMQVADPTLQTRVFRCLQHLEPTKLTQTGLSVLDKQTANNIKQPYMGLF
jgi:hypothetical protein